MLNTESSGLLFDLLANVEGPEQLCVYGAAGVQELLPSPSRYCRPLARPACSQRISLRPPTPGIAVSTVSGTPDVPPPHAPSNHTNQPISSDATPSPFASPKSLGSPVRIQETQGNYEARTLTKQELVKCGIQSNLAGHSRLQSSALKYRLRSEL
jgi:hypothetical protein